MISNFRNFAKSPWAIAIIGLIAVSFLIVGNEADIFASLGPRDVVKAGDRSVTQQEFLADFDQVRENYQQQTGSPVTRSNTYRKPVLLGCMTARMRRPSTVISPKVGGPMVSYSHRS